jgi:hypothetical protein
MKFRYKEIRIRMGGGTSEVSKRVPEWEVPVIQALHVEVTEVRDTCHDTEETPSVSGEFGRLREAYGAERVEGGTKGLPYVEAIYGQHGAGLAALRRAMEGARLPLDTPVTPDDASPELRQDVLEAISEADTDKIAELGSPLPAQAEPEREALLA